MPSPIEFYFDPSSPYAYLATTQIDEMARRHGRVVDWRPMLAGVAIVQVMGLKPLPDTPLKGPYSRQDKHRLAKLLGVPLLERSSSMSSPIAALRAFTWLKAEDPSLAARFARRMCARAWVEGEDIDEAGCLAQAAGLGVDEAALALGMKAEATKAGLRAAVDQALAKGVFGVPFFVVDEEPFWGVDRLWMLQHWLRHGRWDHHDVEQPPAAL